MSFDFKEFKSIINKQILVERAKALLITIRLKLI